MSGLDIDTRADIYSLGVLLYELLTGTTPFDAEDLRSKGYGEMQRIIRETEPLKPSTKLSTMGDALTGVAEHRKTNPGLLAKLVRGDLDWIVMKTLEKDRTRRYETVSSLAADVKRHLNEEPVEAGPPSAIYRIRKFVQRHRRTVAAALTIAATLIIGLVVSTSMYVLANRARQNEAVARNQAEQAKNAEQEQRQLADRQRELAEKRAEDYRRVLYINLIKLANECYNQVNFRRVHELLESCPDNLRKWEWYYLWRISDQPQMTLRGHEDRVMSVAFRPDGKRILSGSDDKTLKVWDAESGSELMTLRGHDDSVMSVAFSPDGKRIVSGSDDNTIKVWDADSGSELMTLRGHQAEVWSVALSPDAKRIISGSWDKTLKVWDANSGSELMTLGGHEESVMSVVFSPDGKRIVSGSNDKTLKIWDADSGSELMTLRGHEGPIDSVAFSPDGKRIVSGSADKTLKVWNADSGSELMTLRGHENGVRSVAFSPDGKRIVSGGNTDNTLKVWDANSGSEVMNLQGHEAVWTVPVKKSTVWSVAFSPDGKRIVSGGSGDNTLKVWDTIRGGELMTLRGDEKVVGCGAFSLDGKRIVLGCGDKTLKVWDAESGSELMTLRGHEGPIDSVAFSPDGKRIVSGSDDKTLKVWDADSGGEVITLQGHEKGVMSVAFSPDGKRIVSGSRDNTIKVWDADSGSELMTLRGHENGVRSVFSPDGKRIVSCSADKTLKVWDADSGSELMTLRGHEWPVWTVAFSPDGKRIVSGSADKTLKVWDADSGSEVMTLQGHEDGVGSAAFSPDGKRIVSCSRDNTIKVWDADSGSELMTLRGHGWRVRSVWSVAFSPDGKTIAAVTLEGIRLWESVLPASLYSPRQNAETARKIVEDLYQKHNFYYDVIDKLQADKTIDEPVRKIALQIANSRQGEDAWKDAGKIVEQLYQKHGYYYDVINELQTDKTIAEPVRKIALQIANYRKRGEPNKLNGESWQVVSSPDSDPNAYQQALAKAEKAISLDPNDLNILNTLGVAQYRVGDYENAVATLTRCEKSRADNHLEPAPENVAFLAMSLHKLDRADEAKAALERLRSLCKEEGFAEDQEAQAFLAEAEKLLAGENK
jgi:WD40 repeat protein